MIILRLFTALIFLLIPTAVRADPPTPVLGFTNPTKGSFDWEDAWYDNFGLIDDIANGRGTCAQRPAASTSLKTKFYVVTNCTDILCDCATTGTTECLTRVNDSGTAWDVGPCQWNEQKIYSILTYGAIPNDSNDDHVEIQLAIDACQTGIGESGIGANIVYFPAGEYRVGDTLLHKSCRWVGAGSNQGTRLLWTGTGGDTMIEKWSTAHPGSLASGGISGMTIKNATNDQVDAPGILLDFTTIAGSLDKLWKLEDMQFAWCTGNAIETNGWTNLHWMNVRWDQIGGYAIYLTPPVTQNLSTFLLDQFTYDHSITSGNAGEGFIYVDNTDANGASNLGTFAIRHGRIEVNASAPWNSPQSVLALKLTATPTGSRSLGARMQDVTYADASGMANDVLLYRDTTN
jgi:hypothetical protein